MRACPVLVPAAVLLGLTTLALAQAPSPAAATTSRGEWQATQGQAAQARAAQGQAAQKQTAQKQTAQGTGTEGPDSPAQEPAPAATAAAPFATQLARWLDVQAASFSVRYRHMGMPGSAPDVDQLQVNDAFRARLKFDAAGRVGVVVNATSGNGFTRVWDNSGWGTGTRNLEFFIRHLYADVMPLDEVHVQFGSLQIARGESTELTSYDNDNYISGERISLRAPGRLFFDEVTFTTGYLGDLSSPDFFDRADRFDEINYYHVLVRRHAGRRAVFSADYTDAANVRTLRGAVQMRVPGAGLVDTVRYEQYVRVNRDAGAGFALSGEKTLPHKVAVGGGFMHVDRHAVPLNGDRYGRGTRVFATSAVPLTSSLGLQLFATRAFNDDYPLLNKTRVDLILSWNILKDLQRAGVVK